MDDLQTETLSKYDNNKAIDFNEPMQVDDDTCKQPTDDKIDLPGNDVCTDNGDGDNSNKENETPETTAEGTHTEDNALKEASVVDQPAVEDSSKAQETSIVQDTPTANESSELEATREDVPEAANVEETAKEGTETEQENKSDNDEDKSKTSSEENKELEDGGSEQQSDKDSEKQRDEDGEKSKQVDEDENKDNKDSENGKSDKDKVEDSKDKVEDSKDKVEDSKDKVEDNKDTVEDDKDKTDADKENSVKEKENDDKDKEKETTDKDEGNSVKDKEKDTTDKDEGNSDKDKEKETTDKDEGNSDKNKEDTEKEVLTIEDESKSDDGVEIVEKDAVIDVDAEQTKKKRKRTRQKNLGTIDLCDDKDKPSGSTNSLLKNQLSSRTTEVDDDDFDDDFDPSLLCPEVSMAVDEAPVNTNSDNIPNDGSSSPLPYEPVFSTYVDEMTGCEISLNLSAKEQALRGQLFGMHNPVQYSKVHCTACNVHLGTALDAQKNRFLHPMLKVLVCKECYNFYTSGEFDKDEDGSELYCRWCGQGGQVFCCSKCEFVFCKKCIRNNFGRKKISEINHSDEWNCFRCDQTQLAHLRAHAAELFEYVRNEIGRASTLDDSSFLSTDFAKCCVKRKNPAAIDPEASTSEPATKKRRKISETDPDYHPVVEEVDKNVTSKAVPFLPVNSNNQSTKFNSKMLNIPGITIIPPTKKDTTPMKPIMILPKISAASSYQVIRPVNSTVRQPNPGFTTHRPVNSQTPRNASPGYIKIVPPGLQNRMAQAKASNQSKILPKPTLGGANKSSNQVMKNEWFVKTVRNTAKVNSNLSYTLTQLGVAQANATTVEALAVVHNKLQEVLSSSINSLIQIRKNLRTEFVTDIRNAKFRGKETGNTTATTSTTTTTLATSSATKTTSMATITIPDDDIIVVNNTTPPPLNPLPVISSTVSLLNCEAKESPSITKKVETRKPVSGSPKRGFIKVKSFSALQSVPSECITIPDEPTTDPLALDSEVEITIIPSNKRKEREPNATSRVSEKGSTSENDSASKSDTSITSDKGSVPGNERTSKKASTQEKIPKIVLKKSSTTKLFEHLPKIEIKKEPLENDETEDTKLTYTKAELDNPDAKLKRILSAKVIIRQSDKVNSLISCNGKDS